MDNLLKRDRIFDQSALPSVAEIVNFRRRALTAKRKKVEIFQKSTKIPPESLASEKCENRKKIARNLVGLGNAKILKILNAEGEPRFPHSPKPDCLMR